MLSIIFHSGSILLDKTMMQSGICNSVKNSNFSENKENFKAINSIKQEVEARVENNLLIRVVPSLYVPHLFEKPPVENLTEVISQLSDKLKKEKKNKKVKKLISGSSDDSWQMESSSDEEESESDDDYDDEDLKNYRKSLKLKSKSFDEGIENKDFFEKPIGSLLMSIGSNLVKEQCDISLYREKVISKDAKMPKQLVLTLNEQKENLKKLKVENRPFKYPMKRCEFCDFQTESELVMATHYETPHPTHRGPRCNYCNLILGSEYKIQFHMETVHNIKARIQKVGGNFECGFCKFDSTLEFVVEEHTAECRKKVNLKRNLAPPADWEYPAKIRKEFSSVIKKEVFVVSFTFFFS